MDESLDIWDLPDGDCSCAWSAAGDQTAMCPGHKALALMAAKDAILQAALTELAT